MYEKKSWKNSTSMSHFYTTRILYGKKYEKTWITMLVYMFFILHGQFEQLTIQNKRDEPANNVLNKIRR